MTPADPMSQQGLDLAGGADTHVEVVQGDRAIWQSETAKTYRCPFCGRPIFSQHEGDDLPTVECLPDGSHMLTWTR